MGMGRGGGQERARAGEGAGRSGRRGWERWRSGLRGVGLRCCLVLPAEGQPEAFGGDGGWVGAAVVGTLALSLSAGSPGAVAACPSLPGEAVGALRVR